MRTTRTWALVAVTAVAAATVGAVIARPAFAHGTMQSPASRTWACYQDGLTSTNEIKPTNPACVEAVAEGGTQPLYDWYGVLNSTANGGTVGVIPDGQLCSGANPKYAAYDAARDDWPATTVTPGASFDFVYGAWVPHPGGFKVYVTNDTYDPTKPLTWANMESEPFLTANPEPAVTDGAYRFSGTVPSHAAGRAIIYTVWFRSDSQETFYSCSDVIFSGDPGSPAPSTSASPSPTVAASPTPTLAPTTCTATVTTVSSWAGGFQANVTLTNTGTTPMNDWYVSFDLPTGDTYASGWNGTWMVSGPTVMVHAPSYATQLAAGATVSAGFLGTGSVPPSYTDISCG